MEETGFKTELELKLAVPDRAVLNRLPAVLKETGCSVRDLGSRVVHDRYLDTEDWSLYRAGFLCRLRKGDGSAPSLTVKELSKLKKGWAKRLEWEENLPAGDVSLPAPLPGRMIKSLFTLATADKPLDAVVTLVKKQQAFEVEDKKMTTHVTVDHVDIGSKFFIEIELELVKGEQKRFHDLAEEVRVKLDLEPSKRDKFSLALEMSEVSPPVRDGGLKADFLPKDRFVDAAHRVMRLHFTRFLWHEPGTRLGMDPEHLHNMRVASRRLLAALWVFRGALPERRAAVFKREFKWVAKTLGQVRDLDIAIKRLEDESQSLPEEELKALKVYKDYLNDQREAAHRRVLAVLDCSEFEQIKAKMERYLSKGPPSQTVAADAETPAQVAASRMFLSSLTDIRKKAKNISPSSPDEVLHAFRRKCKRMRYQGEFFTPLYGNPAKKIAARFIDMQDILGAHQDTVVSNKILNEFVKIDPRPREATDYLYLALGRIMAHRARLAKKQRADFFKAWKSFDRKKNFAKLRKRIQKA